MDKRREEAGEEWQNLEVVSKPAVTMLLDAVASKLQKGREEESLRRLQKHWDRV